MSDNNTTNMQNNQTLKQGDHQSSSHKSLVWKRTQVNRFMRSLGIRFMHASLRKYYKKVVLKGARYNPAYSSSLPNVKNPHLIILKRNLQEILNLEKHYKGLENQLMQHEGKPIISASPKAIESIMKEIAELNSSPREASQQIENSKNTLKRSLTQSENIITQKAASLPENHKKQDDSSRHSVENIDLASKPSLIAQLFKRSIPPLSDIATEQKEPQQQETTPASNPLDAVDSSKEPTEDENSEPTEDENSEPTDDENSEPTDDENSEPTDDENSDDTDNNADDNNADSGGSSNKDEESQEDWVNNDSNTKHSEAPIPLLSLDAQKELESMLELQFVPERLIQEEIPVDDDDSYTPEGEIGATAPDLPDEEESIDEAELGADDFAGGGDDGGGSEESESVDIDISIEDGSEDLGLAEIEEILDVEISEESPEESPELSEDSPEEEPSPAEESLGDIEQSIDEAPIELESSEVADISMGEESGESIEISDEISEPPQPDIGGEEIDLPEPEPELELEPEPEPEPEPDIASKNATQKLYGVKNINIVDRLQQSVKVEEISNTRTIQPINTGMVVRSGINPAGLLRNSGAGRVR